MFQWIKRILGFSQPIEEKVEEPAHIVLPVEEVIVEQVIEQVAPQLEEDSHKIAAFLHTRKRLRERYGYYLGEETYQEWHKLVKTNKAKFVQSLEGNARLYMIEMFNKNIFVVFCDNMIKTVLPFNPEWVKKANSHQKPKGRASRQVGRGDLSKRR